MAVPAPATARSRQAARLARIHDLIVSLPQGYDTVLGDSATSSEGEKQRLTIARAILRDTRRSWCWTSRPRRLDVETEALVMEGIGRLTRGRTTFIIAHRLSTVRNADLILVLQQGGSSNGETSPI